MPVDPQIARLLADAHRADARGIEELTVQEARARGGTAAVTAAVPFEEIAETRDLVIPGDPAIPARLYRPGLGRPPLLVYLHGGGWVVGSVALSDTFCRALANASGCAVLSVEYRLAPEHRYPAAVEDAYAATVWAAEHAHELGCDAARLAVGGSSAGGNLAAVVALMARDRGGPHLRLQLLHVPVTDHDLDTPSYRANATGYGLTRAAMRWFWDHYLPDVGARGAPDASPLRSPDLRGLPPAIVITAECDPLHDEGVAYARRLAEAAVAVTHLEYPGMVHGFMGWSSQIPRAREAFDQIGAALHEALGPTTTDSAR